SIETDEFGVPLPNFGNVPWRIFQGNIDIRSGDIVWLCLRRINESDRVLQDVPLSLQEIHPLRSLRGFISRDYPPLQADQNSSSSKYEAAGGLLVGGPLAHLRGLGEFKIDYLNPGAAMSLHFVFKLSIKNKRIRLEPLPLERQ